MINENNCQVQRDIRDCMMNRIGWFTHLRNSFENTKKTLGINDLVLKKEFLAEINLTKQVILNKNLIRLFL